MWFFFWWSFYSFSTFIQSHLGWNFSLLNRDTWLFRHVRPWRTLYPAASAQPTAVTRTAMPTWGHTSWAKYSTRSKAERTGARWTQAAWSKSEWKRKWKMVIEGRVNLIEREQFRKWKHVDKRSEQTRWRWEGWWWIGQGGEGARGERIYANRHKNRREME